MLSYRRVVLMTYQELSSCNVLAYLCVVKVDLQILGIPCTMMGKSIVNKLLDCLRQTDCLRLTITASRLTQFLVPGPG
jgi:hypothetical protein